LQLREEEWNIVLSVYSTWGIQLVDSPSLFPEPHPLPPLSRYYFPLSLGTKNFSLEFT